MESSKKSFSATAYKQQFKREKYDRLELTMPKGKKQRIQVEHPHEKTKLEQYQQTYYH